MTSVRVDTKCVACDTPALILAMTGFCGTDDESIPCPFATEDSQTPERVGSPTRQEVGGDVR